MSTIKRISEYVGLEYKYGGDICGTLDNEVPIAITQLGTPVSDPMHLLEFC